MGLILDSSVVIAAERRGDTVERLIEGVVNIAGDQDAALSAVGRGLPAGTTGGLNIPTGLAGFLR